MTAAAVAAVLSAGVGPATAAPVIAPVYTSPAGTTGSAVTDILANLQTALICSVMGSTNICNPIPFDPTRTG